MNNPNRLRTGDITFIIGGKTIYRRYTNTISRAALIESIYPMRLEGKECYYTIRPDDKKRSKNLRVIHGNYRQVPDGETCSLVKANQIRMLHVPYSATRNYRGLAKMFGVTKWFVQKVLANK